MLLDYISIHWLFYGVSWTYIYYAAHLPLVDVLPDTFIIFLARWIYEINFENKQIYFQKVIRSSFSFRGSRFLWNITFATPRTNYFFLPKVFLNTFFGLKWNAKWCFVISYNKVYKDLSYTQILINHCLYFWSFCLKVFILISQNYPESISKINFEVWFLMS